MPTMYPLASWMVESNRFGDLGKGNNDGLCCNLPIEPHIQGFEIRTDAGL
jgi:hypothetical protein